MKVKKYVALLRASIGKARTRRDQIGGNCAPDAYFLHFSKKKCLTRGVYCDILSKRLCGRGAMMREIARATGVTSAEYVR